MPRQPEKDTQEITGYRFTALFTYNPISCIGYVLTFKISTNMVEKTKKNGIEVKKRMM